MATLTVTTNPLPTGIGGLFQINYGEKSIQELCNFESSLEDATIESKSKYNGATLIRPLHIQFNKSASATAFGGAAPTPGQETFATISVTVTTIQGACKYEYQANVLSQGDHAYAQVAQTMAQGFVKALALFKDRCLYTGNCTKLVFNQHISGSSSGGSVATWATSDFHQRCDATYTAGDNLTDGGNAGALTLEAAGELSAFIGAIPSDDSTWVPVLLVRNDNAFNGAEQMPGVPYG